MKIRFAVATLAAAVILTADVFASGRIGFYGIVEKVVFEPNEAAPDRIQVWGAFMYVDGGASQNFATSTAKRGYLYFRLKSQLVANADKELEMKKKEWADLKAVAGTGQAVGFGAWGYIASFDVLQPDRVAALPSYLYERKPNGGEQTDLRVRPATEAPSNPATYQTETGVVKLNEAGSHATIVKQLRDALKR
jgi:hypothetical protein